ncbi:Actin-related protein 6 [Zea mays]|uniref:Actin-related protein 6 n=1 Tax=Zea mays TaxID=4577 RepID=A0A1D6IXJ8_MAIZE|nr:Actin-related protein 6 [Zea mays]
MNPRSKRPIPPPSPVPLSFVLFRLLGKPTPPATGRSLPAKEWRTRRAWSVADRRIL